MTKIPYGHRCFDDNGPCPHWDSLPGTGMAYCHYLEIRNILIGKSMKCCNVNEINVSQADRLKRHVSDDLNMGHI